MRFSVSIFALLFSIIAVWSTASGGIESDPEAVELLRSSEARLRPTTSISVYRMELTRPDWQRTMRFRGYDERTQNRSRLEVLEPRKIRGTVFLKLGDKLSMYLPKLRRQIGISPAMLLDPWMGSDFNNQDLLEASASIEAYIHRVSAREGHGNEALITIESLPKPESTVVWSKLVQQLRGDGLPVMAEYYDDKGQVLRRLSFHDAKSLGGRVIPTRWVMTPLDKSGHQTEIIIEDIQFEVAIPEDKFEIPTKKAVIK